MGHNLTYKDLNLLLMMGVNGFGLDTIFYDNGYMYVEMSRVEGTGSVKIIIKQTEKDGLKIYECKS